MTKDVEIPISVDQKPFLIDIQRPELASRSLEFPIIAVQESPLYNLIPTDEKAIRVVYSYSIKMNDQEKDKKKLNLISENLSNPVYSWQDGVLKIGLSGDKIFDAEVPYLPMSYSVDLYIPKDLKFRFTVDEGNARFQLGVQRPEWASEYGLSRCNEGEISYKSDLNAFFCEVKMTPEWKKRIILRHLEKKVDELAPFVGTNWDYSVQYEEASYWRWHSARALDEEHFVIKLSDKFFNLFLKVEANLDKEAALIIKKVELESFEQKGLMNEERIASYQGLSGLDLDLKVQGEKEELLSRIRALEKELEALEMQEE